MVRKLLSVMVTLCLLCSGQITTAASTYDLSGMSYDELVALRDQINLAIWKCEEWQEVVVPNGVWQVGEDIPEGHWTISVKPEHFASVEYGDRLDETGTQLSYDSKIYISNFLDNVEDSTCVTQFDIQAKAGCYFVISNEVVFTPYSGKQNLGFGSSIGKSITTTAAPQPTEAPSESDNFSTYMRDDNGTLILNDDAKALYTEKMGTYVGELLTAIVDYSILCIEYGGTSEVPPEATSEYTLTSFEIVLTKLTKETKLPPNLSAEERETCTESLNLLLNFSQMVIDQDTWNAENRQLFLESLSMLVEVLCVPQTN